MLGRGEFREEFAVYAEESLRSVMCVQFVGFIHALKYLLRASPCVTQPCLLVHACNVKRDVANIKSRWEF